MDSIQEKFIFDIKQLSLEYSDLSHFVNHLKLNSGISKKSILRYLNGQSFPNKKNILKFYSSLYWKSKNPEKINTPEYLLDDPFCKKVIDYIITNQKFPINDIKDLYGQIGLTYLCELERNKIVIIENNYATFNISCLSSDKMKSIFNAIISNPNRMKKCLGQTFSGLNNEGMSRLEESLARFFIELKTILKSERYRGDKKILFIGHIASL